MMKSGDCSLRFSIAVKTTTWHSPNTPMETVPDMYCVPVWLFRFHNGDDELVSLTERHLNEYVKAQMGDEFTAKDFRTWGGTLLAAIGLAERGPADTESQAKKAVTSVIRSVAEKLGNTPAVCRASYISPAVIDQYLDGRTLDNFRPRHLRVVSARETGLDREEQALLSLLRSWRIREARKAA